MCVCNQRELEKQRKQEREQELLHQAKEHYQRTLLLQQGLAPWKRLMEQCHANAQVSSQTAPPNPPSLGVQCRHHLSP